MISFSCQKCGRHFAVPESMAGRRARCNNCAAEMAVPSPAVAATSDAPTNAAEPKRSPRQRRLTAEQSQLRQVFDHFSPIRVTPLPGEPAEAYDIEYRIKSRQPGVTPDGEPTPLEIHRVRIELTGDYPRLSPRCTMLTPIFHPNFDEATICIGDHWTAGERLVDLIIRIGEMIAFQAYNIRSPLNGAAAMWADLHKAELPTDRQNLRPATLD